MSLEIKDDKFIDTRDPAQHNWTIVRAMEEFADDLQHFDDLSKRFVDGSRRQEISKQWANSQAQYDDSQLIIDAAGHAGLGATVHGGHGRPIAYHNRM